MRRTEEKYENPSGKAKLLNRINIIIKLIITAALGIAFFTNKAIHSITDENLAIYKTPLHIFIAVALLIITGIILVQNPLKKRGNHILNLLYACITPFCIFIAMEIVTGNYFDSAYLTPRMIAYNLIILTVIMLLCIAVTDSLKWGPLIASAICILFSIANYYVYVFRSIPILSTDFTTIRTALDVAGNYHLTLNFRIYFGILMLWGLIVLAGKLKETRIFKLRGHAIFLLTTLVFCGMFTKVYITSDYLKDQGVVLRMFRPMDSYRKYGNAVTFSRSLAYAIPEKPTGYSLEAVEQIAEKYRNNTEKTDTARKPNIISVVNETFSDLKVLGDFSVNQDYMPFMHSLEDTAITGTTYASIVGGQTANTEFEYLTNNSMAFLPSQSVAFQLYVKEELPSLVSSLKTQGYGCNIGMHLGAPHNYHRDVVYPLLGFEDFLNLENHSVSRENRVRSFASDRYTYQTVIKYFEDFRNNAENHNKPFEIYDLTIQNHGPFDEDHKDIPTEITLDEKYSNAEMQRYLNLVKLSDEAFQELVEYFKNIDEPTIIIMFGDHQPKISGKFLSKVTDGKFSSWTDEQMMARYAVPFVIWANYDIGTERIEKTSMNYLQTILMNAAGLELTGYQQFLMEMRKQVPVITGLGYFGEDGSFYRLTDTSSPYYDIVHEYSMLQYNNLFDSKNRIQNFFDL